MPRRRRIRRAHARFLEYSRTLGDEGSFWGHLPGGLRWALECISPTPLLALHEKGQRLLSALTWLEDNCTNRKLDQSVIQHYHRLVSGQTKEAGVYRKHPMQVDQSAILRRPPEKVVPGMHQLEEDLGKIQARWDSNAVRDTEDLLQSAVDTHYRIGLIHPFSDGNGRVARLAMNHLLRRYDAGYVLYPHLGKSNEFWESLQEAHRGGRDRLLAFARTCIHPI